MFQLLTLIVVVRVNPLPNQFHVHLERQGYISRDDKDFPLDLASL